MQCRITNYNGNNPWEEIDESLAKEERTLETMTAYGLMAEEFYLWMTRNKEGYELHLEDEKGEEIITKGIHPAAINSMVKFCTRFIMQYNQIRKQRGRDE